MNNDFYQSFLIKEYEPQGLPENYPVPQQEGQLFYIQRNQNFNTVVYELNFNKHHQLIVDEPMKVYWIKFDENKEIDELNYIQTKLAYGYKSNVINHELIQFSFVSYEKKFFIKKYADNDYRVITKINGHNSELTNIYVYAEEFGVFPDVKFVDIYGINVETNLPNIERIIP